MVPIFAATVNEGGRLAIEQPSAFRAYVSRLKGKRVEVIVRRYLEQRTSEANRYYWGIVVPILAEELGYEKQEAHEVLAMRFLRIEDCPITGAPRRKRTPDTDTKEFSDYTDSCIRLAAELGIHIPSADEVQA